MNTAARAAIPPNDVAANAFVLAPLPYAEDALEPVISSQTLGLHHGKHHQGYVDTLNHLVAGTPFAERSLEELVLTTAGNPAHGAIYHNAAQAWNHAFYWQSLSPNGGGVPPLALKARIESSHGDLKALKKELTTTVAAQFGSGWVWLVLDSAQLLRVVRTDNADNPLTLRMKPLLVIDLWEHAYYLDWQNRRAEYAQGVVDRLLNWKFAAANLEAA